MFRPIAALCLSAALALTTFTPSQARANEAEALAGLFIGALVLYGLAEAADHRKDKKKRQKAVKPQTVVPLGAPVGGHARPYRPHARPYVRPQIKPHRAPLAAPHAKPHAKPRAVKSLPVSCIRRHARRHGEVIRVFGNRCLQQSYRHYTRLPNQCLRRFQTVKGTRVGWAPRCLRRAGFVW